MKLSRREIANEGLSIAIHYLVRTHSELSEIEERSSLEKTFVWSDNRDLAPRGVLMFPQGLTLSEKKNWIIDNAEDKFLMILHSRIVANIPDQLNTRYPAIAPIILYHGNGKRYLDFEMVGNFWPWVSLVKFSFFPKVEILRIDGAVVIGRQDILQRFKLHEALDWGEGEDVWWSSVLSLNAVHVQRGGIEVRSTTSKWGPLSYLIPPNVKKIKWILSK